MHFTFVPLIAGLLGVVGCLGSMLLPRTLGMAHVDVVRASGEFFTKKYESGAGTRRRLARRARDRFRVRLLRYLRLPPAADERAGRRVLWPRVWAW